MAGPIIGTVVAAMVAASVGPSLVFGVVVAAVFLQLFENYVLIPRVMVRTVGTNPLVTLLAITAFASVLGIAGAILAIPLAAIVQLSAVALSARRGRAARRAAAPAAAT